MQENFEFCSVDSVYLAQKYSTPLYVMSQDIIEEKIKAMNPLEMTPMEALNYLYELKKEINRKE